MAHTDLSQFDGSYQLRCTKTGSTRLVLLYFDTEQEAVRFADTELPLDYWWCVEKF